MKKRMFWAITGLLAVALCVGSAVGASAQAKWRGPQQATYSGANIFSVAESVNGIVTITVTQGSGPTYLNGSKIYSGQLLGINGLWIVSTGGRSASDITATSSAVTGQNVSPAAWTTESGPAGFGGQNGYGNSTKSDWIALASAPTLTSFGKPSDGYTTGVFTFNFGPSAPPLSNLDFGIDYLTGSNGSTNTGRAYFDTSSLVSTPPPPAPEPSTVLPFTLAGLFVAAAAICRVQRRSAVSPPGSV